MASIGWTWSGRLLIPCQSFTRKGQNSDRCRQDDPGAKRVFGPLRRRCAGSIPVRLRWGFWPGLVRQLGVTFPTAQKAIETLVEEEVLLELTGKPRERLYYSPTIYAAVYGDLDRKRESEAEDSDNHKPREATGAELQAYGRRSL